MKKTTTLITLLLFFHVSFSQQSKFSKIYYDNLTSFSANGMAKTNDGGLIVCGDYNYGSAAIMKIDSLGVMQWANAIGNGSNETFNAIISTTDSCFVLTGKIFNNATTSLDVYVVKIDQQGNLLWAKTIYQPENQEALSIQQTFDGGFIVTGFQSYVSPPYSNIIALKLNAAGDVEWNYLLQSGNNANIGYSVKQTPDSGYAIIGYVENYPPYDGSGILCKLDQTGTIEWTNKYNMNSPTTFFGNDIAIAPDGIYSYYSSPYDYVLVKTDFNGNDNWRESISVISPVSSCVNCVSAKMKLLPDGNLIFATGAKSFAQPSAVVNVDSVGNFNWSQILMNSVHDVEQANDNGFFFLGNGPLLGVRTTTITNPHVGIIKSDSLGNGDQCTSVNPTVSINFGTTTQGSLVMNSTPYIGNSVSISPTVAGFTLTEQVGCVDFLGGIDEGDNNSIKLYPNPATASFSIQLTDWTGNVDLKIVDVIGRSVFAGKYNLSSGNEIKIDQTFAKGVYSVILNSNDKKIVSKFVVQ